MNIRSLQNYNRDENSTQNSLVCEEPTRAQQNFKDQCDINRIVKQYGATGLVPTNPRAPLAEDFINITNYHDAMNAMIDAQDSFDHLPSHLRRRFGNNPESFVDFVNNDENYDEAVKLGLLPQKPVETPPSPTPKGGSEGAAQ